MNKALVFFKAHKVFTGFLIIILLGWFSYSAPIKPTNPNNPLFVEQLFRLRDYDRDSLKMALSALFPVGTPIEYVDLMLVKRGGAEKLDRSYVGYQYCRYYFKPLRLLFTPDAWWIDIYFNPKNEIEVIMLNRHVVNGNWETVKNWILSNDK